MTDSEFHSTIKRVRQIAAKWITPCGLKIWQRVDFEYHRDVDSMAHGGGVELHNDERDVAGRAFVQWEYKTATIHLNIAKMIHLTDSDIDYVIRHEICHLLVHEMREWEHYTPGTGAALRHEERVVTELAAVLGWVRQAGYDDGKSAKPRKKKR